MKKLILPLVGALAVISAHAGFCELSAAVTVLPYVVEAKADRDERFSGFFTVTNPSDMPVAVDVQIENGERYNNKDVSRWLKVKPAHFTVKPGKTKKVKYRVSTPRDVEGELMGMVFFSTTNPGGGIAIGTRFGCAVYVCINGTQRLDAVFVSSAVARAEQSGVQGYRFNCELHNTGNAHFRPRGTVTITRDGVVCAQADVPYGKALLPGDKHTFSVFSHTPQLEKGSYSAHFNFTYGDLHKEITRTMTKEVLFDVDENGNPVVK